MKKGIHPKYMRTTVVCACGNRFETRSTVPEIHVEICNQCHPFFTGRQKVVDSAGRVQKFQEKYSSYFQKQNSEENKREKGSA